MNFPITCIVLVSTGLSKARVVRVNTSAAEIEGLVSEFRTHKQNVMQLLLKQEYQRTQQAQRKRMLQNLTDSFKSSSQVGILTAAAC